MGNSTMNKAERQAMMQSMIERFFAGMGADEKKEMCAAMIGKLTEGLDLKEMMPGMMMGMMSGGGPGGMKDKMAEMQKGGGEHRMPEMMLKTMMPHCIGMMLPMIEAEKRRDVAAAILSSLVEKGTDGLSEAQARSFRKSLAEVLER